MGAKYIASMLKMNDSLSALFLTWNLILSKGGHCIIKALERNPKVQVFDISFNNLGEGGNSSINTATPAPAPALNVAEAFKSLFLNNKTLIHIDISHCKLVPEELRIMSKFDFM